MKEIKFEIRKSAWTWNEPPKARNFSSFLFFEFFALSVFSAVEKLLKILTAQKKQMVNGIRVGIHTL